MTRKILCVALCALFPALAFTAEAQQPKKIHRIGYLSSSDRTRESARAETIRQALRELGYIEGQNISIEYRYAVLYDPASPGLVREVKEVLPVAARGLRLTIEPWEIRDSESLNRVFTALNEKRPGGLYAPGGRAVAVVMNRIAGFTLKSRLPSIYQSREFIGAGGLMSYGANEEDSYRRVVGYVDKILKGAKPADLPVQQPTKFELVINLKTAQQIGVMIPQKVLARTDRVIK